MMKLFVGFLIGCISFISFGQEQPSRTISWEELDATIAKRSLNYVLIYQEITPSLSYIRQGIVTGNHTLIEVNLAVDIRKQHLEKDTPMLLLPENKFVQSEYDVAIPSNLQTNTNNLQLRITGSGGYSSRSTNNPGGIKNNAYRDASTYTRIYCPVTGVPLN